MNGVVYRVIPKQVVTVPATLPSSPLWISKGIDVTNYTQAVLIVRTHQGTNIGGGTGLQVSVYYDAPTSEEATDFLPSPLTPIVSVTVAPATSLGTFQLAVIGTSGLSGYLRVGLIWPSSSSGQAVISADICAKC